MTKREKELFRIFTEIQEINQGSDIWLTGSLCFAVLGIEKPREAVDIDICTAEDYDIEDVEMPEGYECLHTKRDGDGNYLVSARYYNEELGLKVEFLVTDMPGDDPIKITSVDYVKLDLDFLKPSTACYRSKIKPILDAKREYAGQDYPQAQKHRNDIDYIVFNNSAESLNQ